MNKGYIPEVHTALDTLPWDLVDATAKIGISDEGAMSVIYNKAYQLWKRKRKGLEEPEFTKTNHEDPKPKPPKLFLKYKGLGITMRGGRLIIKGSLWKACNWDEHRKEGNNVEGYDNEQLNSLFLELNEILTTESGEIEVGKAEIHHLEIGTNCGFSERCANILQRVSKAGGKATPHEDDAGRLEGIDIIGTRKNRGCKVSFYDKAKEIAAHTPKGEHHKADMPAPNVLRMEYKIKKRAILKELRDELFSRGDLVTLEELLYTSVLLKGWEMLFANVLSRIKPPQGGATTSPNDEEIWQEAAKGRNTLKRYYKAKMHQMKNPEYASEILRAELKRQGVKKDTMRYRIKICKEAVKEFLSEMEQRDALHEESPSPEDYKRIMRKWIKGEQEREKNRRADIEERMRVFPEARNWRPFCGEPLPDFVILPDRAKNAPAPKLFKWEDYEEWLELATPNEGDAPE